MVAVGGRAAKLIAAFVVVTMLVGCGDDDAATDDVTIGGQADIGGPVAWPAPPAEDVEQLTSAAGLALEKRVAHPSSTAISMCSSTVNTAPSLPASASSSPIRGADIH